MGPTSNSNQFFGVKVSQVGIPVNQAADSQLVYKSNFSTNLFNGPNGIWKVMEGTRVPTTGNGLTAPQQGFWVAQDGVDVQQANDGQMIFNSSSPAQVNPCKFLVYRNAAYTATNAGFQLMPMDAKVYDTGSNVDVTDNEGRFTAPFTGFYQFSWSYSLTFGSPQLQGITLYKNGIEYIRGGFQLSGGGSNYGLSFTTPPIPLDAADYIEPWFYIATALGVVVGSTPIATSFGGELVSL